MVKHFTNFRFVFVFSKHLKIICARGDLIILRSWAHRKILMGELYPCSLDNSNIFNHSKGIGKLLVVICTPLVTCMTNFFFMENAKFISLRSRKLLYVVRCRPLVW